MTTTTDTRSTAMPSSLASSAAFRTFAVVFAIVAPVIYVACEMQNWPLFTYHPGTNRFDWFYASAIRNEGPAMHWYGWTANMLIGSAALGILATFLPERLARRIPLSLVWIVSVAAVPVLIYALRFFWRW
jgi:RsiW-degrading membrane proteinase PrsW (M82 family)